MKYTYKSYECENKILLSNKNAWYCFWGHIILTDLCSNNFILSYTKQLQMKLKNNYNRNFIHKKFLSWNLASTKNRKDNNIGSSRFHVGQENLHFPTKQSPKSKLG